MEALSKGETIVKTVEDGEIVYYEAELWQGRKVQFKIRCQCGGETEILTVSCHGASDPRYLPLSVAVCSQCERELYVGIFFYAYEVVDPDKTNRFHYYWRRRHLFPLQIKCPCGNLSFPLFIHCLAPTLYKALSLCQGCQSVLETEVEFYHI